MATRVIDDTKLQNIAVAIQGKDSGGTMTVDEMPTRIAAIPTGDEVLFSSYGRQYTRTVEIPDGVTTLGEYAFQGCTGLTEITLPDSLTTINSNAFQGCTGLTEIDLNNVTTIKGFAFQACTKLHSINLENITTFSAPYVFDGCTALKKINCKSATSISSSCFNWCTSIESAICKNATVLNTNAFLGNVGLKYIDIRNVTQIKNGAFSRCKSLSLIDLTGGNTVCSLDHADAFYLASNTWTAVVANDNMKTQYQSATNWSTFASHFRTIAEVEAEVGMTYDEYYYQLFGEPRNEVTP